MKQAYSEYQQQVLAAIEEYKREVLKKSNLLTEERERDITDITALVRRNLPRPLFDLKLRERLEAMSTARIGWTLFIFRYCNSRMRTLIQAVVDYHAQDQVIVRLNDKISDQQAAIARMLAEHKGALEAASQQYRSSIAKLAEQLHACQTEIGVLKSTIRSMNMQVTTGAGSGASDQVGDLQARVHYLTQRVGELEDENSRLRQTELKESQQADVHSAAAPSLAAV